VPYIPQHQPTLWAAIAFKYNNVHRRLQLHLTPSDFVAESDLPHPDPVLFGLKYQHQTSRPS
jgi:hypothetical protein